jgi:predicted TIM-barrel fold metal-dependent hydrolase
MNDRNATNQPAGATDPAFAKSAFKTNERGFRRIIRAPQQPLPPLACDTHMHIVGPFTDYPLRETRSLQPPEATLDDYRGVLRTTGLQRNVIVQPSFFAKDNACTLDAAQALGANARAVVVVDADVAAAQIAQMHACGARGVRLQRIVSGGASIDDLERIAERIGPFGWHIQLYLDASELPELASRLRSLPVDVVFDHMAHIHRGSGVDQSGFGVLLELLAAGRTWVKLSGARFVPDAARARRLIEANPERMLWGSDWPHVAYEEDVPDEGRLLDLLAEWAPDEALRRRILVDNPALLYFSA